MSVAPLRVAALVVPARLGGGLRRFAIAGLGRPGLAALAGITAIGLTALRIEPADALAGIAESVVIAGELFVLVLLIGPAKTPLLALLPLLLFLAGAIVGQDAEIMVRELQIIFRVHPIAHHLRIARHVPIFLEQLGSIATGAIVDPVAGITIATILATATTLTRIISAAAMATGLTIVDQVVKSLLYGIALNPKSPFP